MKELYSIGNNPKEQGLPLFEIEGNEIYPSVFIPNTMQCPGMKLKEMKYTRLHFIQKEWMACLGLKSKEMKFIHQ